MLSFTAYPPVSPLVWLALAAGTLFSFPILPALQKRFSLERSTDQAVVLDWARNVFILALFIAGIIVQAGTSYLPFIYGEF